MNDEQVNGDESAETPAESAEVPSTHTLSTILQLIDAIPESEMRLREQLRSVAGTMSVDGDLDRVRRTRWRRAVQLFGNRVHELKQASGSLSDLPKWSEWGIPAIAIIDAYRPDGDDRPNSGS